MLHQKSFQDYSKTLPLFLPIISFPTQTIHHPLVKKANELSSKRL
ncbi:hypothetical protein Chls_891 [Chlamydia suis]|uniref:Uncharacterized protein n=1 Tax=Chlamydia suis TaxID=83559 RepID=A0ABX6IRU4_9CHLA|nr:hypothetical protein Chls_891 [Chlamydia suis]